MTNFVILNKDCPKNISFSGVFSTKDAAVNLSKLYKTFYGGIFVVEEMTNDELEEFLKTQKKLNGEMMMSLNDDWKAGKLKNGWYFCKIFIDNKKHICPVFIAGMENDFEIIEVIDHCNYEELQRLKVKNEELKQFDGKNVCAENEILQVQNAELMETTAKAAKIAQDASEENEELRELLKDCRSALSHLGKWNTQRQSLLTRIETIINKG